MNTRISTTSVTVGSLMILLAVGMNGCGKTDSSTTTQSGAERGEVAENVHNHSEEPGKTAASVESLDTPCEHDIPIYQCDECRYEVGVVKLASELFKDETTGKGLVRTAQAARMESESFLEVTGEIQFNDNAAVHVTPRVTGIISSVRVDVGTKVKKGDVLFEMESVELGEAMAAYLKSRSLTDLSRKTCERKKTLFDQKISSESALIEAQMTFEEHKSELDQSEQQLHVLGMTEADILEIQPGAKSKLSGRLPFRAPL
ncbi:MAG: efflux RND transporter periplasmic adaptor subunit, partial [bacterium]